MELGSPRDRRAKTVNAFAMAGGKIAVYSGMWETLKATDDELARRQSQTEADAIGIELAARAGFDPHAAVTLWEKMGRAGGAASPEFLSTHPSPDNRRQRLQARADKLQPVYQAEKGG